MPKYNLTCIILNRPHFAIFTLLEIFFSFRGKTKTKMLFETKQAKQAQSTTVQRISSNMFQAKILIKV